MLKTIYILFRLQTDVFLAFEWYENKWTAYLKLGKHLNKAFP